MVEASTEMALAPYLRPASIFCGLFLIVIVGHREIKMGILRSITMKETKNLRQLLTVWEEFCTAWNIGWPYGSSPGPGF